MFQSTPLREGRRPCGSPGKASEGVSIHAPARGATHITCKSDLFQVCFNPRPCARGDRQRLILVQIHNSFQSTPLRKGRPPGAWSLLAAPSFQSTPLREGRPGRELYKSASSGFQSTPLREGRLFIALIRSAITSVSIHAPARGATWPQRMSIAYVVVFQSTPLREGRRQESIGLRVPGSFNPRPCARGDVLGRIFMLTGTPFQSTPLREGRRWSGLLV